MLRTITLLASASALALAGCGDDNDYDDETRSAAERGERGDEYQDGLADGELDEGIRVQSGDESPDGGLGQTPPVNLAQDMAAAPVGLAAGVIAGLSGDVDAYVRNVSLGNTYEIQAGRLAMERGNSEEVREIGQMLVTDHERLQNELRAAVSQAGLDFQLPSQLDGRRQGMIDNLNAASDVDFDAAFLHQQEGAHLEAAALHEGFEAAGDIDALTRYAGRAGNTVQDHLGEVTSHLGAAVDGE